MEKQDIISFFDSSAGSWDEELIRNDKVIEKIFVNQYGIPVLIHRIIGGNVFDFAKLVGLSPLSPDQTKEFEHILECCAFTFVDENVIYNAENKIN